MIPEGWKKTTLSAICQKIGDGIHATPKYIESSEIRFINGNNLQNGVIDVKSAKFISETELSNYSQPLGDNTLLLSINGTIGNLALYKGERVLLGKSAAFLNVDREQVSKIYVYYLLQSADIKRFFDSELTGSTIRNLSLKTIRQTPISLPQYHEQKRITEILYTWDRAIEVTEKLIANSEAQKKALMQKLLTGKERLPGFEGEWGVFRLDELAVIKMGSSPKSENYNEIGIGLPLLQGNADILGGKSNPRVYTSVITQVCEPRDILLSVRAPVGSIAISEHEACIGRGFAAIKANEEVSHTLLLELLRNLKDYWLKLSQGSTFESINSKDVKSLNIMLPKRRPEQEALGELFSSAQSEIESRKKFVEELRAEKSALMQQLLTGKRRVKIDKEAAA